MSNIILSADEQSSINLLLKQLSAQYNSVEDDNFLKDVGIYAHELPRRVRTLLNDFKVLEQPSGIAMISGFQVDQDKIGATPAHWKLKHNSFRTREEEMLLILFGSLLGDVLGWSTQQAGHVVHDVLPIQGHEHEQLGSSSEELLTWHNEDAFHPYRCDYLGMMCLRNPDEVATMVACLDSIDLSGIKVEKLFEACFTIRPDESHLEKNKSDIQQLPDEMAEMLESAYRRVEGMNRVPEKIPVLFGHPTSPYVRIDPYFMDNLKDDPASQSELTKLIDCIDANITDLILHAGDIVFIDNFRVVHGRRPFKAKFDGRDRWLKRITLTRDLRKSRNARLTTTSRIIY
jgi:Fe(II)/alpha-ketoglutarate-dependent arginine beta-hydroxylase